jgi:LPXTG-site transpeptidase (sortase) family protein
VVLIALVALPILPAMQIARSEPRPAETSSMVEETPEPAAKATGESRESAYEKLALNKLTIEREVPEEPAPAPEPELKPQNELKPQKKEPERRVRAGATSVDVLPGPAPKATEPKPPERKPPERKAPVQRATESKATNARPPANDRRKPRDTKLPLSIPRLGLEDVAVGDSPEQSYLDREGIVHLSGTGFPYERGSNTYIVGHAADYNASRVPNVFNNLKGLKQGDTITLRDTLGRTYEYRAYQYFIVNPTDVWITEPVPGKEIISLQTCYPAPSFAKRLIIRAERVK